MHKRLFMIIVLAILLTQPVVVGLSMPFIMTGIETDRVLAQDYGYRVDPIELSEHVAVIIDGTADFDIQGWPGEGTENDPYLISKLNITADIGDICIYIANTDAYFVIRDCYVDQRAATWAIELVNTTHGVIEYTNIKSVDNAVFLWNANNTQVIGSDIFSEDNYAVNVADSEACTIQHNKMSSNDIVLRIWYSPMTRSIENSMRGISPTYGIYSLASNYTSSLGDNIQDASTGIYSVFCYHMSINGTRVSNVNQGMSFTIQDDLVIDDVEIEAFGGNGIYAVACDYSYVTNSVVSTAGNAGMYFLACEYLTLRGNDIMNADSSGLYLSNCDFPLVEENSVVSTGSNGMYFETCVNSSILRNVIEEVDDNGIYLTGSGNSTVQDNIVSYANMMGIRIEYSNDVSIIENAIEYTAGSGIHSDSNQRVDISDNSLRYTANGIYTEESDNATLIGNEIAKCVSRGIYLTSSLYPTIVDNSIESVGSNGIDVSGANNASISANSIQDSGTYGIQLLASSYGVVHGNAISDATTAAMYISGVLESEFTDNTMVNCGFLFEVGSLPNFIHLIDGNTVNGLPVYYEPGLNSQDILASNYGQILLVNNSWITVHDGVLDHASIPIEMAYSSNCDFANVDTSYSYIGVAALYSENMTFQGLTHIGDGVSSGMVVFYSSNVSVENSEFLRARSTVFSAITTSGTSDVTISESLFDGNFGAIRITGGSDILISDNHILNTAVNSVYMDSVSDYIRIINNEIHNSTYGIRGSSSYNWTIMDNTVMYCSQSGIYITGESSDYVNITLNSISNNADGIRVYEGDDASITNNTIMWNSGIGIELISSLSTEVFYNLIALNFGGNGDDSAAGNYWDDGSTLGNAWDDFTPPAPYQVDTNTQDRYPIQFLPTEPIINQPQDIYYAEGSEGNEITWYAFDDSLKDWSVTIDGDDWASDAWDFNDITVNIDGLLYGTHTVEVTLYDVDQNSVSDTVLVHVYDGTSPSINNVPNTWSFVSGSGQTLTWQVYDLHPDTYIVHVDDEEFDTDTWTSGELEVNIDGLTEGLHTLLIEIYDIDGNVAFDQVEILVIDDTIDPTVDSPSDITYTLGETGNSIVWNAEDQYPLRFEVAYNGSTMVEGSWGGSRIAISVDGLSVGSHVFTITVEDGGGNTATDSVTVSVLPIQEQVTPPPPIDLGVLLIILGVVGAAIVVVAVVFFLKKRR